jgi:hypothetical protein
VGAQRVEKRFVAAARLQILKAAPSGQHVVRQRQDVIRLMVGQVPKQEVQPLVDLLPKTDGFDHALQHSQTATANRCDPIRDLVPHIAPFQDRRLALRMPARIQPRFNRPLTPLAIRSTLHLKRPPFRDLFRSRNLTIPRKAGRFLVLHHFSPILMRWIWD